jgi:hypothetical protein
MVMLDKSVKRSHREGGQAIVLVTLGLIAMCGMMGMATDMGLSYYTHKLEQAAADAAALGTVRLDQSAGCPGNSGACPSGGLDTTKTAPIAQLNLNNLSGSGTSWDNGRGTITGQSGAGAPPWLTNLSSCGTTAIPPCALYYVSVTMSDTVPQLFSAVIGNPVATVGVRSSAVLGLELLNASFVTNNRSNDTSPILGQGTDVCVGGNGKRPCNGDLGQSGNTNFGNLALTAPSGIYMASTCGGNCSGLYAGYINDGSTVTAPFTQILGASKQGWINGTTSSWAATPTNVAASPLFNDPLSGIPQPPLITATVTNSCPGGACAVATSGAKGAVLGGVAGGATASAPTILNPGVYYTTNSGAATGDPVYLNSGFFQFKDSSGFGTYIFYGGLHLGLGAQVTFGPGMYIFAGANSNCTTNSNPYNTSGNNPIASGPPPCPEFTMDALQGSVNAQVCDGGFQSTFCGGAWSPTPSDAGELFVYTDLNYPALSGYTPSAVTSCGCLTYGTAGIYMNDLKLGGGGGNGQTNTDFETTVISLHGLYSANLPSVAASLSTYAPYLMWQDRGNSYVKYSSSTNSVDTSCGSLNSPCTNTLTNSNCTSPCYSPEMDIVLGFNQDANTNNISGAVYQPRGAWLNLGIQDRLDPAPLPLQVVTGAILGTQFQFSPKTPAVALVTPPQSVSILTTGLVE